MSQRRAHIHSARTMIGRDVAPITILLGASRVALAVGDRDAAERHGREAIAVARARRDEPGMAASLELTALTTVDHGAALGLVEEAAAIWSRPLRGLGRRAP